MMMPYNQTNEDNSPTGALPTTKTSTEVNMQPGPNVSNTMGAPPLQGSGVGTQGTQQVLLMVSPGLSMTDSKARVLLGLAATQLILGILLAVGNIIATVEWAAVISYIGPGYWCGTLYVVAGSLGIAGVKNKIRCMVISFLVLSIISTLMTIVLITISAIGLSFSSDDRCSAHDNDEISCAFNGIFLVLGITETVISIVSAAMCCSVIFGAPATYVACPVRYVNGTPQVVFGGQFGQPAMAPTVAQNQPVMIVQQPGQLQVMGATPPPSYSVQPHFN